jgi:A/G-specific adenine glycosylase
MRPAGVAATRRALLDWYEPRRRAYPWRRTADPFALLVSEVMLQQTQAPRVAPAFERFLASFPTVEHLSSASVGEVIRAWGGLGYNRRAVSLHRAARLIVSEYGGRVPRTVEDLGRLPGVGPYTAAAVASIAYDTPVAAIDTNVRRVVSRLGPADEEAEVAAAARRWLDRRRPGDWNQAVMDLGREVCRPRPACERCPVRAGCASAGVSAERSHRVRGGSFEGSTRQLRGAIVAVLRGRGSITLDALAEEVGRGREPVVAAVRSLHADGLALGRPEALAGDGGGHVALP